MKKLTLRFEGMKDMLTREQMKKVNGGSSSSSSDTTSFSSGAATCHADCNTPAKGVTCKGDVCNAIDYSGCATVKVTKLCKN